MKKTTAAIIGLFVILSTNLQASFLRERFARKKEETPTVTVIAEAVEKEVLFSTKQMSKIRI